MKSAAFIILGLFIVSQAIPWLADGLWQREGIVALSGLMLLLGITAGFNAGRRR